MKKISKKIIAFLLVLSLTAPALLIGCFFLNEKISFTRPNLEMIYGDTADLTDYIKIENQKSGVFTLTAAPAGILQINGNTVKAVGTGKVTVTAVLRSGGRDALSVTVRYAEITEIELFESGRLYQDLPDAENVTFTVFLGDGADTSETVNWYLNQTFASSSRVRDDANFILSKKAQAGEYRVRAELASDDSLFAEKTLRVYNAYQMPVIVFDGEDIYGEPTSVSFGFQGEQTHGNPEYLFEMYVNGELADSVHAFSPVFTYSPKSAGVYVFGFKLNGKPVLTAEGGDSLTVRFRGVVTPYGLSLDFDNDYPSVYLKWANREETRFTVLIKQDGVETTIPNVDASAGFYDLGGKINITKNCEIKVKSESFGEIYLGGDWVSYNHTAINQSAVSYLNKKFLDKNYYMTSDDEVFEFFDFMLIFRPNAVNCGDYQNSECTVYLGYNSSATAQYFVNRFKTRLTITGNYWTGAAISGKTLIITLNFYSGDTPTNFSIKGKLKHEVLIAPVTSQTGYSGALPVESFKTSASSVSNSNQLYYTLEQGLKPLFENGSAAESLYDDAKTALKGITDNGMSEAETARAIFDYVMFCVSYDTSAAGNATIDSAVLQPAFYVEGVLKTGFAVCDGIAKTYSLLCNMMDIKCIRIVGTAKNGRTSGDHAWNKVMIDGEWYIADATWGVGTNQISGTTYKLGSHDYFLLSDADVVQSHAEMSMSYPKTALIGYGWYIKNDLYFYHNDTAGIKAQIETIADKIYALRGKKQYSVMTAEYYCNFSTYEFQVAPTLINAFKTDSKNEDFLMAALSRRGVANYEYLINNNTVIIAVR